ncbi:MAG: helix-turn-helix domain-containing protein [Chloroflexota bacterium]
MDKLGRRLREARQAKGVTLQEAEAATCIRAHFLESLEAGDFAAFGGGDVQVRGFLSIYARYLELPPEDVIRRYVSEVRGLEPASAEATTSQEQPQADDPPDDLTSIRFRPRDIPMGSSLPRWMSVKTVIILGLVLTTLLGILALATYLMNQPEAEQPLALLGGPAPTRTEEDPPPLTPTATLTTGLPTPTFPLNASDEVSLVLEATEYVQVRVREGDEIAYQDTMAPGQVETWTASEVIVIETANGAALRVSVNGADLGPLCEERAELCTRAWGPEGEVTP